MAIADQLSAAPAWPSAAWKARLRKQLAVWYSEHARDLPWRRNRNPYFVWISEIMLQQTQVTTVEPFFERFIAALPTVMDLAAADEQQVLKLWEGLGYYRRARQLHRAAKIIAAEHGGEFPRAIDAVRSLPGIGRYTTGAITSIAFDSPQPILEANTVRLFSRLLAYRDDPTSTAGQRLLWRAAEELLPKSGAGDFNQALMDLGSRICTPRDPRCLICPLANLCPTREQGLQAVIPQPRKKQEFTDVQCAAVVVRERDKVLLVQRTTGARWIGLWDFPRFEIPAGVTDERQYLLDQARELTGLEIELGDVFQTLKHGVTRFRITLKCYEARVAPSRARTGTVAESRWLLPAELTDYPLNTTGRKIASMLADSADAVQCRAAAPAVKAKTTRRKATRPPRS